MYHLDSNYQDLEYENEGRFRLTKKETDRAMFKVPTLRNVSVTSPYMHDGSLPSLESVIDHYGSGGKDHLNKSSLMKEFSLSENEKEQLIAFLNTLTDHTFMNDQKFKK